MSNNKSFLDINNLAKEKAKFKLDPRTKLLLLLVINIIIISGGTSGISGIMRLGFSLVPFGLLLLEKKFKAAFLYMLILTPAILAEYFLINSADGIGKLAFLIVIGFVARFLPGLTMGYYFLSTTKISELIASLEKMHLPQSIIIPFAVMLRFLPTVKEENSAIADAMKMRGIGLGGKNNNIFKMLEYRLVPMLMSTVRIGEELSAAALTRGLGGPEKRTNICQIGIKTRDILIMTITSALFITWIIMIKI